MPFLPIIIFSFIWYFQRVMYFLNNASKYIKFLILIQLFWIILVYIEIFPKLLKYINIADYQRSMTVIIVLFIAICIFNINRMVSLVKKYNSQCVLLLFIVYSILFSLNVTTIPIIKKISMNIFSEELKIHTNEYENIKHIIPVINKETKVCTGLMAYETSFIGGFTNLELDKLFILSALFHIFTLSTVPLKNAPIPPISNAPIKTLISV